VIIDTPYDFGDIVFLKTDIEQHERMVTKMSVESPTLIHYELSLGSFHSWHNEYEFERELSLAKKLGNND
jgi:hypothetical protein